MTEPAPGVYEHLITHRLAERLHHLDAALLQHGRLDPADSHEFLTRHLATLISRALKAVPGGGDDRLARQVELANRLADAVADLNPDAVTPGDQVVDTKTCCTPSRPRPSRPRSPPFPSAPPPRSPPARCWSTAATSPGSGTRSSTRRPPPTTSTCSARSSSGRGCGSWSRPYGS
ncbi:hypothetical protein [Micromonospora echinospora]|uniref:hypothetical protein n=1 Tax=Micromonospora echinospora TaxID=1877 RepID=UPI003A8BDBEB